MFALVRFWSTSLFLMYDAAVDDSTWMSSKSPPPAYNADPWRAAFHLCLPHDF